MHEVTVDDTSPLRAPVRSELGFSIYRLSHFPLFRRTDIWSIFLSPCS